MHKFLLPTTGRPVQRLWQYYTLERRTPELRLPAANPNGKERSACRSIQGAEPTGLSDELGVGVVCRERSRIKDH